MVSRGLVVVRRRPVRGVGRVGRRAALLEGLVGGRVRLVGRRGEGAVLAVAVVQHHVGRQVALQLVRGGDGGPQRWPQWWPEGRAHAGQGHRRRVRAGRRGGRQRAPTPLHLEQHAAQLRGKVKSQKFISDI